MTSFTIQDAIVRHVRADGPVSFNSIYAYVCVQQTELSSDPTRDRVAWLIGHLLRRGDIGLYDPADDGIATYW